MGMEETAVANISSGASLSPDGQYRYRLWRHWDLDAPIMRWVMLNPSTADAAVDDPTIRRCIGFARREHCGGIEVVNLYALRATNPAELSRHPTPEGPDNAKAWRAAWDEHPDAMVVAAWGAHKRGRLPASKAPVYALRWAERSRDWRCLGRTKSGAPRHPLFVRADQPLERW